MSRSIQDRLNKFADDIISLEGRDSTEDKYTVAFDLMLSLLDDLGMVSTVSSIRRLESEHLEAIAKLERLANFPE